MDNKPINLLLINFELKIMYFNNIKSHQRGYFNIFLNIISFFLSQNFSLIRNKRGKRPKTLAQTQGSLHRRRKDVKSLLC